MSLYWNKYEYGVEEKWIRKVIAFAHTQTHKSHTDTRMHPQWNNHPFKRRFMTVAVYSWTINDIKYETIKRELLLIKQIYQFQIEFFFCDRLKVSVLYLPKLVVSVLFFSRDFSFNTDHRLILSLFIQKCLVIFLPNSPSDGCFLRFAILFPYEFHVHR